MTTAGKTRRKPGSKKTSATKAKRPATRKKRKPSLNGSIMDNTLHKRIKETLSSVDKAVLQVKKKVDTYRKEKKPTWAHLGDLGRILSLLKEI